MGNLSSIDGGKDRKPATIIDDQRHKIATGGAGVHRWNKSHQPQEGAMTSMTTSTIGSHYIVISASNQPRQNEEKRKKSTLWMIDMEALHLKEIISVYLLQTLPLLHILDRHQRASRSEGKASSAFIYLDKTNQLGQASNVSNANKPDRLLSLFRWHQ